MSIADMSDSAIADIIREYQKYKQEKLCAQHRLDQASKQLSAARQTIELARTRPDAQYAAGGQVAVEDYPTQEEVSTLVREHKEASSNLLRSEGKMKNLLGDDFKPSED